MKGVSCEMFGFIREHQMNIMLALCAVCTAMAVMLILTRFLSERRKWIMVLMELTATLLLASDRMAYKYKGDISELGFIMVRVSNFMVFFLTSAIVLIFNLYLIDLLTSDGKVKKVPNRLKAVNIGALMGMALVVLSSFTGLYYSFDAENNYHRGPGFLICYIVPVFFPIVQYTVIRQYKKLFSRLIYTSLVLYIFVPIIVGIIQIFTYGISIVNMAMVLVSVCLYIFTYLDINAEVERAHEIEVGNLQKEQKSMKRLFDQTVTAFVNAVEMKDKYSEGHSVRVAEYARRIAKACGRSEDECEEVYYAALLHDVGMIGIPDNIIEKGDDLSADDMKLVEQKPVMSEEILSSISEYPYLSQGARYSCERYDGKGYPDGLKGQEIPEISRIIAAADTYDNMTSKKRNRDALSYQVVREEFIKMSGGKLDPEFSEMVVRFMDEDHTETETEDITQLETELRCGEYRDNVSMGIPVLQEITKIHFECDSTLTDKKGFSAPSVILFDSYNRHIHRDPKTITAYRYVEFGEIWFDGHYVSTNARNIEVKVTDNDVTDGYEITAGRYDDHLSVKMISPKKTVESIIALPDNSKTSYIGLTGENCLLKNITADKTGIMVSEGDIRKIVGRLSYIDRIESDMPNIQIDHNRSASTEGILINDEVIINFHTMSLPSADLVWHCPYIVLFNSENKKIGGKGYLEYALIKINGEVSGDSNYAENRFYMKKGDTFAGWDDWKQKNKSGLECSVHIVKKGNKIILTTSNLGIDIENTTIIEKGAGEVYAAITGDQVAVTDIRIR